jgi:hypothetical protein
MRPLLSLPPGYKPVLFWMVILIVVLITLGLMMDPAPAHDALNRTDWIGEHAYTNKHGGLCCGINDCEPLSQEDIEPRVDGVWLPRYKELVPYNEATPSEDHLSYRCRNAAGWRTCFFFKYGAS